MPLRLAATAVALLALTALAGCSDASRSADGPVLGEVGDPGPLPSTSKATYASNPPPVLPISPAMYTGDVRVPAGTARLLLAFDLATSGDDPLDLRLIDASGESVVAETVPVPGKLVLDVRGRRDSDLRVVAESPSDWTIALVATAFPAGFRDGLTLFVATPDQTEVEHRFHPDRLDAAAGQPIRIVLHDFDPHEGIANLQHNLAFPALGLRTEGKTTWGEVRVLDLPPLAAGTYAFECEFHGFAGELAVA